MKINGNLIFKSFDWIVFLILGAIGIFLTWEVLLKYWAMDTSMKRLRKPIEKTPAIGICFTPITYSLKYGIDFNISRYSSYADYFKDQERKNVADLNEIFTTYAGKCYKVPSSKVVGKAYEVITVNFNQANIKDVPKVKFYITSEDNFFGIFYANWIQGEILDYEVQQDSFVGVNIKEEQYIYLEETNDCLRGVDFLKCAEQKLTNTKFDGCPRKCLPYTSPNPNQILPICDFQNFNEFDCARLHNFNYVLNNLTSLGCKTDCKITQFVGKITYQEVSNTVAFRYSYPIPEMVVINEEFLIYDIIGLIGAIGGTMGIFIGFSISNTFSNFLHYFQMMVSKCVPLPKY